MLISRDYIAYLEQLPCNKHARRRQQRHGKWLDGWVANESIKNDHAPEAIHPAYSNIKNNSPS